MKKFATFLGTSSDPDFLQSVMIHALSKRLKREKLLPLTIFYSEKVI